MNKLELPGIMICEWDAETKCMIVSPAEGWKVNVNYPISEAHASMVTMEKMDGPDIIDLKSLTGMWVKCTTEDDGIRLYKEGSWYQIGSDYWMGSCWNTYGASEIFDLTDARDYNPDEKPEPKPHKNALTLSELEEGKSYLLCKHTTYTNHEDKIATEGYYYEASPTFRLFASELTKGIDHGTDHEFISKYFEKHVHQPKPERKPHQLQEYDAVECTPEERSEIIRIADECGINIYKERSELMFFPYLLFVGEELHGCKRNYFDYDKMNMFSASDFIAKIRGEYTENKVNVSEHKHPQIV